MRTRKDLEEIADAMWESCIDKGHDGIQWTDARKLVIQVYNLGVEDSAKKSDFYTNVSKTARMISKDILEGKVKE